MAVVGVVGVVVVAVLANLLWFQGVRFAAHCRTTTAPDGERYDILVNREGVGPYTRGEALLNLYANIPIAVAMIRHRRRGPWLWAVRVRRWPFRSYPDLMHEVVRSPSAAEARASVIEHDISNGVLRWPEP